MPFTIVRIVHQNFDIFELNEVLFYYDQPLLGG